MSIGPRFTMNASIRSCASRDALDLSADVLTEAKTATGAWSLATHTRLSQILLSLKPQDIEDFLTNIIERLISPDIEVTECFKLAQICTMCRKKDYARVGVVLANFKTAVLAVTERTSTAPLWPAIKRLLLSLYIDHDSRRVSECTPASIAVLLSLRKPCKRIAMSAAPRPA